MERPPGSLDPRQRLSPVNGCAKEDQLNRFPPMAETKAGFNAITEWSFAKRNREEKDTRRQTMGDVFARDIKDIDVVRGSLFFVFLRVVVGGSCISRLHNKCRSLDSEMCPRPLVCVGSLGPRCVEAPADPGLWCGCDVTWHALTLCRDATQDGTIGSGQTLKQGPNTSSQDLVEGLVQWGIEQRGQESRGLWGGASCFSRRARGPSPLPTFLMRRVGAERMKDLTEGPLPF